LNSTGAVIALLWYDSYGKLISAEDPDSGRYRYTGWEFDSETGLHHTPWRKQDPRTGRWTTVDPIGFTAGDPNLYRDRGNSPTNATDPDGLYGSMVPVVRADGKVDLYYVHRPTSCLWLCEVRTFIGTLDPDTGYVTRNGRVTSFTRVNGAVDSWSTPQDDAAWDNWFAEREAARASDDPSACINWYLREKAFWDSDPNSRDESLAAIDWLAKQGISWYAGAGFNVSPCKAAGIAGGIARANQGSKAAEAGGACGIVGRTKPVNLPSWGKLTINWQHIRERHIAGGIYAKGQRTVFGDLTERQVEALIREAYKNAKKLQTQGERILVEGCANGWRIQMWINTATNTIETAYPLL
jgi:RHS repeat-associated protein